MKRVLLIFLVFVLFAAVSTFAFELNTITIDLGPTFFASTWSSLSIADGEEGLNFSGFGFAAQYERQTQEDISFAGKVGYLGIGMGIVTGDQELRSVSETSMSAFTLEGHARYYPGRRFFIDGMAGLATFTAGFKGDFTYTDEYGFREQASLSFSATRFYLNFGCKIGWRFIGSSGFTFEPSFGYYSGFGLNDTIGKQVFGRIGGTEEDAKEFDNNFKYIEDFLFIGGPRLSLAFGYSF